MSGECAGWGKGGGKLERDSAWVRNPEEMRAEDGEGACAPGPGSTMQRKESFTGEYPAGLWDSDLDP